jgi:hypothetical protein
MATARGWHEAVTITCIVIAAIVEAAEQALASAPKVSMLLPAFIHNGFWNYVPLAFLIIAGAIWLLGKFPTAKLRTSSDPAKLFIHRAFYGFGPSNLDITDKLRAAPRDALVIPVDNNLVPYDPIFGVRKQLVVNYSYGDGVVHSVSRRESMQGDMVRLVLPEDSEIAKLKSEIEQLKKELQRLS